MKKMSLGIEAQLIVGSDPHGSTNGKNQLDIEIAIYLGGGFNCSFIFTPIPGEMIQFDEHIFQMGRNHQLERPIPLG